MVESTVIWSSLFTVHPPGKYLNKTYLSFTISHCVGSFILLSLLTFYKLNYVTQIFKMMKFVVLIFLVSVAVAASAPSYSNRMELDRILHNEWESFVVGWWLLKYDDNGDPNFFAFFPAVLSPLRAKTRRTTMKMKKRSARKSSTKTWKISLITTIKARAATPVVVTGSLIWYASYTLETT